MAAVVVIACASEGVADSTPLLDPDDSLKAVGGAELRQEAGLVVVSYAPGDGLAGVAIGPPASKPFWDVGDHAHVVAAVQNVGDQPLKIHLRADNAGSWRDSPWNTQSVTVRPGESREITVWFGYSYGKPGFDLNASRLTQLQVFAERRGQRGRFRVERVWAGGRAGEASPFSQDATAMRPPQGALFDAAGATGAVRIETTGGAAQQAPADGDEALVLSLEGDAPASVRLSPRSHGSWDLRRYNHVDFELYNPGDRPITARCLVGVGGGDNLPQTRVDLPPGESRSARVEFLQPPVDLRVAKEHSRFDSAKVSEVSVHVEHTQGPALLELKSVVADLSTAAPEHLGKRPPAPGRWRQTLDENFDGKTLDSRVWIPRMSWDGPLKSRPNRYSKDNVVVRDGRLVLLCEKKKGHQYDNPKLDTREYTTGTATTIGKWTQRYGYFEAKMKLAEASGLWPAFWMMPDRGAETGLSLWKRRATESLPGYGQGMEVDIIEHLSRFGPCRYNIAAHWDGYGKQHQSAGSPVYVEPTDDGWLVGGLLWEPGKMTWFCNGRPVGYLLSERVPDVPLFLKLTVDMGGWGGNHIVDSELPAEVEVDYVRAWQRPDWGKASR